MGCDIHCCIEWRDTLKNKVNCIGLTAEANKSLVDINVKNYDSNFNSINDRIYNGRNYALFTILAGVRTREPFMPISPRKGVSNDASYLFKSWIEEYGPDGHSASWLTLKELQDFNWDQEVVSHYGNTYREASGNFQDTIEYMEEIRKERNLTSEDVRFCFFFDN